MLSNHILDPLHLYIVSKSYHISISFNRYKKYKRLSILFDTQISLIENIRVLI